MGRFRILDAMPFIAILIAVGVGWHFLGKETDARVQAISQRIEAEKRLREDLAQETRERVADNERQITQLKATNVRQTRLILALAHEFPQLADELHTLRPNSVPESTARYVSPPSRRGAVATSPTTTDRPAKGQGRPQKPRKDKKPKRTKH